ncbi:helix-turn-helix domain-containing protein [Bacillus subtilis]|uniref:helix-turn-helix domain-containing protein n=1 Tax=Bacillus TaxID=1386 RepID=UPI003AEFDA4F
MSREVFILIRKFKGMRQSEYARWLGITPAYVNMIESGARSVSEKIECFIALNFDATSAEFLEFVRRYENLRELG